MKNIATCLFFYLIVLPSLFCQSKHDYIWPIGYGKIGTNSNGTQFGGVLMDFNQTPPALSLVDYICDRPRAAISDNTGQLVAYTEGCRVINRNHQVMLNGDTLNPGDVFDEFCSHNGDYPLWQTAIFLPKPGSDSLYYLFHLRCDNWFWNPMNLMYTVIDASGDGGNGIVIAKNKPILSDSIYLGNYVTATKHANGRDWWVVVTRRLHSEMHVSLLSPDGVTYMGMQPTGFVEQDSAYCCGQTCFSPDGSKYFRSHPRGLLVLDFDRCHGTFSNPIYLTWDPLQINGGGVAVSPNSRFLYLSTFGAVRQYDLWASDLAGSMQIVATYDGTMSPLPTTFFQMMPAPDGQIYMNTSYDNNILHVIHHPNELGLACDVEQHAINLPALSGYFITNFANYNLGPLDHPCTDDTHTPSRVSEPLKISPNPSTGIATVLIPDNAPGHLAVYNTTGQKVYIRSVEGQNRSVEIDLGKLPNGVYRVVYMDIKGGGVASALLSILH